MAYWAKIDNNNIVIDIAIGNKYWHDSQDDFNMYILYDINKKRFPSVGYTYDSNRDAFIPPQPKFPSWTLNEDTCLWESPTPHPQITDPNDSKSYNWNESTTSWDLIPE